MKSCIYKGQVRHRRFSKANNSFEYKLFMMYIDLDEIDSIFNKNWLWSNKHFSPAWFRRKDYLDKSTTDLKKSVYELVYQKTGKKLNGPVRLLTHLRYFGYIFNPISLYYCFDNQGENVECIVAEVSNTPWREQHHYVLDTNLNSNSDHKLHFKNSKEFHVSPFMKMDMEYDWRVSNPSENLLVHIENIKQSKKVFDATLKMNRHEITSWSLTKTLFSFPVMTIEIIFLIYLQAVRLWLKKVPYIPHPNPKDSMVK